MNPIVCAGVFNTIITKPFSWLLRELYLFCGNYGVAIILFTVIVKLVLLYFGVKSKASTMKTSRLQPKLKALEAKYPDDKTKYQMEMSKLYKEEGINPFTGCLWTLIPFPFLIGLYGVLRQPLTNLMGLTEAQITTITDTLANLGVTIESTNTYYVQMEVAGHVHQYFDQIKAVVPQVIDIDFSFLGMNLAETPQFMSTIKTMLGGFEGMEGAAIWGMIGLFLMPFLSGLMNFLSSWIMQKQNSSVIANDKGERDNDLAAASMNSMKTMLYLMPLMSVYIGFICPAGLCVYWTASSALGLVQDVILTKILRKKYDAEDAVKAEIAAQKASEEAEKEAKRAEYRKAHPNEKNPNTSKRKIKNMERAAEIALPEGRLTEDEIEEVKAKKEEAVLKASGLYRGEHARPYARGRNYDPDRYNKQAAQSQSEASEEASDPVEPDNE